MKTFRILRCLGLLAVYGVFLGAGATYYAWNTFAADLPDKLDEVMDYRPSRASRVYSADGELIGEFFLEKRVLVPLARIPEHVKNAFISAEDRRFYDHRGFDPLGIFRAAYANYVHGEIRQGASTITQQVTRMLMLSHERTLARKAREVILAVRVDRELSKEDILYIYLNHVYLGHGAYGVQAAAEIYFGKDVEHLTVAEAAMLAGLPRAPSKTSPYVSYERARERQAYVLRRMREDGVITPAQETAATREPLAIISREQPLNAVAAPYFVEHVRRWANDRYGHRSLFLGGLRIYTTLDMKMQRAAEAAVQTGLENLDKHLGFRGPIGHLDGAERIAFAEGPPRPYTGDPGAATAFTGGALLPGVTYAGLVTAVRPRKGEIDVDLGPRTYALDPADARRVLRWRSERKREEIREGDLVPVTLERDEAKSPRLVLSQVPDVQAALVAIDPRNGDIKAMVGGYDYGQSQFNRATQARRQIGSAMKPFIYATALEHGATVLDIVPDTPIAVRTATGVWAPKNYKREYLGPVTLKTALAKSINTVSVRLTLSTGVDPVLKTMRKLGIESPIPRHISIALGTPDVSPLEVTAAIAAFPAGGKRVPPRFIKKVVAADGQVLEEAPDEVEMEQAIPPAVAYLVVDLMKTVVERGTGRKARDLGRPAAGKTGTSTGFRDAWFFGYTVDLVAGVWVGRDDFTPIGEGQTGGRTSLPIWLDFMKAAHPDTPVQDFEPPADITFVRASETTGQPMPPGPGASWVPFVRGSVPPRFTARVDASRFRPGAVPTQQP